MIKNFGSSHYRNTNGNENNRNLKETVFNCKIRERPGHATNIGNNNINNSQYQMGYSNNRAVSNNFGVNNLARPHISTQNNASSEQSEYRALDAMEIKKKYKKDYNPKNDNHSEDEVVENQKKNLSSSGTAAEEQREKAKIEEK